MKKYLSTSESAKKLSCTNATIINYINRGWLQGHKFITRWLVDYESLKKLILLKQNKKTLTKTTAPMGDEK